MANATRLGTDLWKSMPDSPEKYQAYLCSREWAERRNAVYKRCGCVCERCNVNAADHVHHLTYARKYNERSEDLQALCRQCHEYTHGKSDHDPAKVRDAELLKPMDMSRSLKVCEVWPFPASVMLCPVCGFDYCHPLGATNYDGCDNYQAPWSGRGDLIAIEVWCECGHAWELCVGFHKGTTYMFTRNHRVEEVPQ